MSTNDIAHVAFILGLIVLIIAQGVLLRRASTKAARLEIELRSTKDVLREITGTVDRIKEALERVGK